MEYTPEELAQIEAARPYEPPPEYYRGLQNVHSNGLFQNDTHADNTLYVSATPKPPWYKCVWYWIVGKVKG